MSAVKDSALYHLGAAAQINGASLQKLSACRATPGNIHSLERIADTLEDIARDVRKAAVEAKAHCVPN